MAALDLKRIIGLCVDQERGHYRAIAEGSADDAGKPLVADSHQSVEDAVGRLIAQNPAYFAIHVISLDD
jgi:hypothetical protein